MDATSQPAPTHPNHMMEPQFIADLNTWIIQNHRNEPEFLRFASNSQVLPTADAPLMNQTFFERVVPAICDVIDSHPPGHPPASGSSPNNSSHNNPPSDFPQLIAPIPLTDENQMALQFAARHRGM